MRPQDILVLLKILSLRKPKNGYYLSSPEQNDFEVNFEKYGSITYFQNNNIALALGISPAEVSESLHRSIYSGLIDDGKTKNIHIQSLIEFLKYGIKYVFPVHPGALVRGIPTAHAAPPLNQVIVSDEAFVWASPQGTVRGQAVEPLYHTVPLAVQNDPNLYELVALVDAIRMGSARVYKLAIEELEKRIQYLWASTKIA